MNAKPVLLAALLLVTGPAVAGDTPWRGDGPFPPAAGSRRIEALLIDPATRAVYAGSASGTVFVRDRPAGPVVGNPSSGGGALDPLSLALLLAARLRKRKTG